MTGTLVIKAAVMLPDLTVLVTVRWQQPYEQQFFVGFVGGWFLAFCRNFVLAATVFWVRTKANLAASRDFLDHI